MLVRLICAGNGVASINPLSRIEATFEEIDKSPRFRCHGQSEYRSQIERPWIISDPFQLQLGTGEGRLKSQEVRVGNSWVRVGKTHSAGQKEQPQRAIRTCWSCKVGGVTMSR